MRRGTWLYALVCLASVQTTVRCLTDATLAEYLQEASKEHDWMVETRRELHQWPELMYQEHNTSLFLRKTLDDLNIPYKYACKHAVHCTLSRVTVTASNSKTPCFMQISSCKDWHCGNHWQG